MLVVPMLVAKSVEVCAILVLVVPILVAIVDETLAMLAASVPERATAKSLTDVILVLAVLILVAIVEDTLAILAAKAAEVAARTVPTEVILEDTEATDSPVGIAEPAINILVAAKTLLAETSPENSAAAPDTLVRKLPVEAITEEILSSGFTLSEALTVAVETEVPFLVISTVSFSLVIFSKRLPCTSSLI